MKRDNKECLIKELESNNGLLGIKELGEYRRNGVIVKVKKADTGFMFDKELILIDGTSLLA